MSSSINLSSKPQESQVLGDDPMNQQELSFLKESRSPEKAHDINFENIVAQPNIYDVSQANLEKIIQADKLDAEVKSNLSKRASGSQIDESPSTPTSGKVIKPKQYKTTHQGSFYPKNINKSKSRHLQPEEIARYSNSKENRSSGSSHCDSTVQEWGVLDTSPLANRSFQSYDSEATDREEEEKDYGAYGPQNFARKTPQTLKPDYGAIGKDRNKSSQNISPELTSTPNIQQSGRVNITLQPPKPKTGDEGHRILEGGEQQFATLATHQSVTNNREDRLNKFIEATKASKASKDFASVDDKEDLIERSPYQLSEAMCTYLRGEGARDISHLDPEFKIWRENMWANLYSIPEWLRPEMFCRCLTPDISASEASMMCLEAHVNMCYRRMLESQSDHQLFEKSSYSFFSLISQSYMAPVIQASYQRMTEKNIEYMQALCENMRAVIIDAAQEQKLVSRKTHATMNDFALTTQNKVEQIVAAMDRHLFVKDDNSGSLMKGTTSYSGISTGTNSTKSNAGQLNITSTVTSGSKLVKPVNTMF